MKKIYTFVGVLFAICLIMRQDSVFAQEYGSLSIPQQQTEKTTIYPERESSPSTRDAKDPVKAGSIRVNREDYVNGKLVTTLSPEDLVKDVLLGQGASNCAVSGQISNVTFAGSGWDGSKWDSGSDAGRGLSYFCGGTENETEVVNGYTLVRSLDMESGLLLTTGLGRDAEGPNDNPGGCGSGGVTLTNDPHLSTLVPGIGPNIRTGAKLEFDFVPMQNEISFDFIFASEEYTTYVNSDFNDIFGFFIWPVSNPASFQNIALLPNSAGVVSINNVHWGQKDSGSGPEAFVGCPSGCPLGSDDNPAKNPEYYVPNYYNATYRGQYMQYNARTVMLTAKAIVTPGTAYHLKLIISNVYDSGLGSGVFLRAGSLDLGSGIINLGEGGVEMGNIFEGCETNELEINFPPSDTETTYVELEYEYNNGATIGDIVQFPSGNPMPTSFVIPPLGTTITIPYKVISPIVNGSEIVIIATSERGNCEQVDTLILTLYKALDPEITTTLSCKGNDGSITVTVTTGSPDARMTLDDWDHEQLINVPFTGLAPGNYLLEISDYISCDTLRYEVTILGKPVLSSDLTILDICTGGTVDYTATCDISDVTFSWERIPDPNISPTNGSGTGPDINETLTNTSNAPITVTYVITLNLDDCDNTQEVTVVVHPDITQPDPTGATIPYNTTHTFTLGAASGGYGAISYLWEESADGIIWTAAAGTNNAQNYTTPALVVCEMYYRRKAKSANCDDEITSDAALITLSCVVTVTPDTGGSAVITLPDNSGTYDCGTEVTVEAEADECYTFAGWSEKGNPTIISTDNPYTFIVDKDYELIANFEFGYEDVIVTIFPPNTGSVTGAGTNLPCGETITLTAEAEDCYAFSHWEEDGKPDVTDNPYIFTLLESHTLVAVFELGYGDITVAPDPPIGGTTTITSHLSGIDIPCGEEVTVLAEENECYTFLYWTEDDIPVSYTLEYTFTMEVSRDLVAVFELNIYIVTETADPPEGGMIMFDPPGGNYDCGTDVTVDIFPNECYTYLYLEDNGVNVGTPLSYTINDLDEDHDLIAYFELNLFDVILSANPPEPIGGTVSGGGLDIECDTEITIVATPDDCYTFVNWTEGSTVISTDDFYTFEVKKSWNLVANFQIKKFNVTVSADPEEGGDVFGGVTNIDCNTEITVWAEEDYCYTFINWTEDGDEVSDQLSYTFDLTADRDLVANFELKYFTISVIIDPPGSGTVTGDGVYPCYDYVELVATPDSCHYFVSWTDENNIVVHPDSAYAFIATGDRTLTANFERKTITIVTIPDPAPGGMTNGNFIVPCGTLVTLEAYPNPEYDFVDWTYEDGTIASTNNPYIFTATEDLVLTANFVLKAYQILVYANPNIGGNSVGGGGIYSHYDVITVHAYAGDCYDFIQWTDEFGVWVSDDPDYTFTVTGPRILVADFYLKNYVIITVSDPPTGGVTYGDGSYDCHELVTVIAEPIDCYD
ncbi:MAG: choice-of-anchor L domain-containing protein, partial [Bacteroidales bacterium]|nr:choice-of-anchor L domain-containing protein [Bacteroidales bacterium]